MVNFNDLGKAVLDVINAVNKPPRGGQSSRRVPTYSQSSGGSTRTAVNAEETIAALEEAEQITIIDVRSPKEYAAGHIKESINIPFAELATRAPQAIKRGYSPVTVSTDDALSARACETLRSLGYNDANWLEGGVAAWNKQLNG